MILTFILDNQLRNAKTGKSILPEFHLSEKWILAKSLFTLGWPNTVLKSLSLILHKILNYLCFGAHFLQESRLITEVFILAF